MDENALKLIKKAKRNCLLCCARRNFETETERSETEETLKELTEYYNAQYNYFRARDESAEEINNALDSMRFCRELTEKCRKCNRETDQVNRAFAYKI